MVSEEGRRVAKEERSSHKEKPPDFATATAGKYRYHVIAFLLKKLLLSPSTTEPECQLTQFACELMFELQWNYFYFLVPKSLANP